MRCLALAEEFAPHGAHTRFICHEAPPPIVALVERRGFGVITIPCDSAEWNTRKDAASTLNVVRETGGADILIVDRYGVDAAWEKALRPVTGKIVSIDDLADKRREPDILINQNYLPGVERRYGELVPDTAQLLLGPSYALIRDEFLTAREKAMARKGDIRNVLISFGGSDPAGATLIAMRAIGMLERRGILINVVIGPSDSRSAAIEATAASIPGITIHRSPQNMAELTASADLVIGAFGVSTWERLLLGAPSMIITVAENQEAPAAALSCSGYVVYLGKSGKVTEREIAEELEKFLACPALSRGMSEKGMELVDGLGARRAAKAILS